MEQSNTESVNNPVQSKDLRTQASEAYVSHWLKQIACFDDTSLSESQKQQIRTALLNNGMVARHPVDVRVSIPLYFIKFYVVFLIGRDTRDITQLKEKARAFLGKTLGGLFSFYLALCIFLPFIFFALYLIKSWLGIDIFPNHHLSDFF